MNPRTSISQDIRQRLAGVRAGKLEVEIASQSLLFFAFSITLGLVVLLGELLLRLNSPARTIIILAYFAVLISFAVWFVFRPLLKRVGVLRAPTDFELALYVGDFFPGIRDRLLNLLQLHEEASAGSLYSPELIDASFEDLAADIERNDFLVSVDRSSVRQSGKMFLLSAFIVAIPAAFAPGSVGDALYRLAHFSRDFVPESHVQFDIVPGNREVIKGDNVPVAIRVYTDDSSMRRSSLAFRWRPREQTKYEEQRLIADSSGLFTTTLSAVRASTEYYAEFLNEESDRFLLTVVDRPVIRSLRVRLDYPSYTRLGSQIQDEFVGDVTAIEGTQIRLTGRDGHRGHTDTSHGCRQQRASGRQVGVQRRFFSPSCCSWGAFFCAFPTQK